MRREEVVSTWGVWGSPDMVKTGMAGRGYPLHAGDSKCSVVTEWALRQQAPGTLMFRDLQMGALKLGRHSSAKKVN